MKTSSESLKDTIFSGINPERKKQIEAMAEQMVLAIGLVERLRGPNGCPWDREQNHLSLRQYLIEEAYEVLDILDQYTPNKDSKQIAKETPKSEYVKPDGEFKTEHRALLQEELGDLLLQVLLHSQLADERKDFGAGDVAETMARKLVHRHPHVFGDQSVKNADEVLVNWELQKKREGKKSTLDGLPKNLPSLQKASRIGDKVSKVGFDWTDWKGSWDKVKEEIDELEEAIQSKNKTEIELEMGDLFFAISNLARHLKIEPESAHRKAIEKFETRFRMLETLCAERGIEMEKTSLEDLDRIWDEVKQKLKG